MNKKCDVQMCVCVGVGVCALALAHVCEFLFEFDSQKSNQLLAFKSLSEVMRRYISRIKQGGPKKVNNYIKL